MQPDRGVTHRVRADGRRLASLLLLALLSSSCDDAVGTGGCGYAAYRLSVRQNSTLAFEWSPTRCPAYMILVYDEAGAVAWWHQAPDLSRSLPNPMVYSTTPPFLGAVPFDSLEAGSRYRIELLRPVPGYAVPDVGATDTFTFLPHH